MCFKKQVKKYFCNLHASISRFKRNALKSSPLWVGLPAAISVFLSQLYFFPKLSVVTVFKVFGFAFKVTVT